jgi:predicted RNase H-like nuclease (RuvC/YqgF family)
VDTPVMKVKNSFIDVTTGLALENEPRDKFIRLLNHESYTIQIPKLQVGDQSRIENVLSVFSQRYKLTDDRKLDYQGMENDPLKIKIINRLTRAIADDNLRRKMDLEDEFERGFMMELEEKLSAKELEIKKRDQEIEQRDQEIEQRDQEIEQRDQEIEQRDQEIEQKDKIIEALMKQINESK